MSIFAVSMRPRLFVLFVTFGALSLVGCKQGVGQRCEQNSDCSSGICGDGAGGAVSAMGRECVPTLATNVPVDAASDVATSRDTAARDTSSSDATSSDVPADMPVDRAPGDAAGDETSATDALEAGSGG